MGRALRGRRVFALLPEGPFAQAALALIVVGVAVVLRKGVPKAYGLAILMVGVFALDFISRLSGYGGTQGELGYRTSRFLHGGAWWSPLTAIFTHAAPSSRSIFQLHIFGNLLMLVAAGPALESRIGERKFLVVFFLGGLVALLAHSVLGFLAPSLVPIDSLAIGASGAIFAVLSTFAIRYPREPLPVLLLFFLVMLPAYVVLVIFLGFNVVYALSDSLGGSGGIAWWGHFAGFLVGLAFAYSLPRHVDAASVPSGPKGLPDVAKLEPYATTPELRRILENVRQFSPDARTAHDSTFSQAWVDKFFAKAQCPQGHAFRRDGMRATCSAGETKIEFARAK